MKSTSYINYPAASSCCSLIARLAGSNFYGGNGKAPESQKLDRLTCTVMVSSPLYIVAKCEVVVLRYVQVGTDFCRC
jgi:hypothetical protein